MPDQHPKTLCVGIIGCGAIGAQLSQDLVRTPKSHLRLVALNDAVPERARELAARLRPRPRVVSLAQAAQTCDLLVEAAGLPAVRSIAAAALRERKDLLVLSVGALITQPGLWRRFQRLGRGLYYPSGAVIGLDGLRAAAAQGGVFRVKLTTRKPPRGLAGAPYFEKHPLNLSQLKTARRVFRGSARQAIAGFPANVNVAAAVSLAGIGPDRTQVEIIADPQCRRNVHTLEVSGRLGRFTTITENVPSPENSKTSALAAASASATLRALAGADQAGTCAPNNLDACSRKNFRS